MFASGSVALPFFPGGCTVGFDATVAAGERCTTSMLV